VVVRDAAHEDVRALQDAEHGLRLRHVDLRGRGGVRPREPVHAFGGGGRAGANRVREHEGVRVAVHRQIVCGGGPLAPGAEDRVRVAHADEENGRREIPSVATVRGNFKYP